MSDPKLEKRINENAKLEKILESWREDLTEKATRTLEDKRIVDVY